MHVLESEQKSFSYVCILGLAVYIDKVLWSGI
jgi:hypothetical protein